MYLNHKKKPLELWHYLRFRTQQQQIHILARQFFITSTMLPVINDTGDNLSEVLLSTVESAFDFGPRNILIEKKNNVRGVA